MSITSGSDIVAADFVGTSSGAGDSGKVAKLNSVGQIEKPFIKAAFGGTGTDGALAISSGTTTINCAGASLVILNYTSLSITGTGKLAFSNYHANGTTILIRVQGNVTLTSSQTPMIDCSGMGAIGGTGASDTTGGAGVNGNPGTSGICALNSWISTGGTGGTHGGPGSGGVGGAAATNTTYNALQHRYAGKYPYAFIGAGAGGGAAVAIAGAGSCTAGDGGRGGGCLIIECGGALNFTTTSGLSVKGGAGTAASNGAMTQSSEAGGSSGPGGYCLILYNTLTANTGTITISGGTPGAGATIGSIGSNTCGTGGTGSNYQIGVDGTQGGSPTGSTGPDGLSFVLAYTEYV